MITSDFLQLLLLLLLGLLAVIGGLLPSAFDKQYSLPGKCLIFGLGVMCGVLALIGGGLITTPEAEQNAEWMQKVYWNLGIGYAFSLPTAVYLLWNKLETDQPADDYRTQLLKAVQTEVEKRLADSLSNLQLIDLQIEEQPHQVGRPQPVTVNPDKERWALPAFLQVGRLLDIFNRKSSQLEPDRRIIDIFHEPDIAGKLLILGAPGSGKTTMLLELARDLIGEADADKPIPVLFDLSGWKDDKQSITDWLVSELKNKYGVRIALGKQLVETHQILPLLDGLDELEASRQGHCIEKINQFLLSENRPPQLVVCSRLEEYEFCKTQLSQLNGAVCLQPLTDEQIKDYLNRVKRPKLWQSIQSDNVFKELAASPFLLTIMVVAYEQTTIQQAKNSDPAARRQFYLNCLFDAYIERQLSYPLQSKFFPRKQPDAEQTKRCLKFLARQLRQEHKTEFLIEKMQIFWLEIPKQKWLYSFNIFLMLGLIWMVIGGTVGGLIANLNGLLTGLILGLFGGLLSGITEVIGMTTEIKPVETLKWTWKAAWIRLLILMPFTVLVGGFLGRASGSFIGLIAGFIIFILLGLVGPEIKIRTVPNQGILESVRNFGIFTLIAYPPGVLISLILQQSLGLSLEVWSAIIFGLAIALLFGINVAGFAGIQHFTLRLSLWVSGCIPWNYARFLNYSAERRLLQRVGGRYRFIHDLLREHFANMGE